MSTTQVRIKDAAAEFLALRRIAVTGVSAHPKGHGSNVVYQRLRERGYDVFAVNPNAGTVEGDRAYASLKDIPGGVEGVVIATAAERAPDAMREIIELGVATSGCIGPSAREASRTKRPSWAARHGITVIDGGCPLMFGEPSDGGHRLMCRLLTLTGKVPRTV